MRYVPRVRGWNNRSSFLWKLPAGVRMYMLGSVGSSRTGQALPYLLMHLLQSKEYFCACHLSTERVRMYFPIYTGYVPVSSLGKYDYSY